MSRLQPLSPGRGEEAEADWGQWGCVRPLPGEGCWLPGLALSAQAPLCGLVFRVGWGAEHQSPGLGAAECPSSPGSDLWWPVSCESSRNRSLR